MKQALLNRLQWWSFNTSWHCTLKREFSPSRRSLKITALYNQIFHNLWNMSANGQQVLFIYFKSYFFYFFIIYVISGPCSSGHCKPVQLDLRLDHSQRGVLRRIRDRGFPVRGVKTKHLHSCSWKSEIAVSRFKFNSVGSFKSRWGQVQIDHHQPAGEECPRHRAVHAGRRRQVILRDCFKWVSKLVSNFKEHIKHLSKDPGLSEDYASALTESSMLGFRFCNQVTKLSFRTDYPFWTSCC